MALTIGKLVAGVDRPGAHVEELNVPALPRGPLVAGVAAREIGLMAPLWTAAVIMGVIAEA